jgi:hypothetical protein
MAANIPYSEGQVLNAVQVFLVRQELPKDPVPRRQVDSYLHEVFLGASELPSALEELSADAVRRARFQGYGHRIFKTPASEIPPAYMRAYRAWQALR